MNDQTPFLWTLQQNQENDQKSSAGGESQTASANEESKNALIDFE